MAAPSLDELNASTRTRVAELTEQVRSDTERGVDASVLIEHARTIIKDLPAKERGPATRKLNAAKDTPRKAIEPAPADVHLVAEAEAFREVEGMDELVHEAASRLKEAFRLGLKMSAAGRAIGHAMLEIRLRLPGKGDLPDLKGESYDFQQAARAAYDEAASSMEGDEDERLEVRNKVKKAVQNQASNVLVPWLRELDSKPERLEQHFPEAARMVKKTKGLTPSEAVYALYAKQGIDLPRMSRNEIQAAKNRGELTAPTAEPATYERDLADLDKMASTYKSAAKHAGQYSEDQRQAIKMKLITTAGELAAEAQKL